MAFTFAMPNDPEPILRRPPKPPVRSSSLINIHYRPLESELDIFTKGHSSSYDPKPPLFNKPLMKSASFYSPFNKIAKFLKPKLGISSLRSRSEIMEDGASVSSASGSAGGGQGSSSTSSSTGEEVLLRIHVPELTVEKCMQFHKEDLVWEVKQQALANLPKELRESFNYGLFYPPQNGRAGKFLDEERPLSDYPFSSPVGYLELKYKRRVYKMLNLEEKSLRALHTRANLRRFLDYVKDNNVDKVGKMCNKGLDPNFHCQDTGETPLTFAARLKKGSKMILALVNGGCLLDYRTKDGLTPMHRAVQADNYEVLRTLLDLGASPNSRDIRGLTPLYYTVTHAKDPMLCEALLHDYSVIGASDNQGWQETHQACRNKLVQHLEHLLFFGADMNAQNASGNTPLHVCAVNNLEDCARVLLFRGCDKNALNYANQTPYQVAVIAGNMDLAQIIQNHASNDVVQYKEPPKYNPKRRISGAPLSRAHSDPRLEVCIANKPPSPSPSNRSIPPFSSASSLSETSTGSGSTCTHPSEADSEECASAHGSSSINTAHENSDIVSDSSGVCISNSGSNDSYDSTIGANSSSSILDIPDVAIISIGMLVVCLKQYTTPIPGHLNINPGDIIEVTASTDDGMLEGTLKGRSGLFPPQCVQEIRLRNPKAVRDTLIAPPYGSGSRFFQNRNGSISSHSSDVSSMTSYNSQPNQIYGTTPRMKKVTPEARTVILHRGKKGFGFVLRGAKATSPLIERPYERGPALQYLDDVDPGGVADEAGLKKGDYLLKINGEDVSQASHEHVVNIIKKSGDLFQMSVMSPASSLQLSKDGHLQSPTHPSIYQATATLRRGCQTLPRKFSAGDGTSIDMDDSSTDFKGRGFIPPPAPPPRDPRTTLSVGRARARSMVAGLHDIEALDASMRGNGDSVAMSQSAYHVTGFACNSDDSSDVSSPNAGLSPRGMPNGANGINFASSRLSTYSMASPLSPTGKPPKVYASVAEMKKAKALKARMAAEYTRLHKDFHSTPDLQGMVLPVVVSQRSLEEKRKSLSQEDLFTSAQNVVNQRHSVTFLSQPMNTFERRKVTSQEYDAEIESSDHPRLRRSHSAVNANQLKSSIHPPPTHPPPPVPMGQVIKMEVRSKSDYAAAGKALESPTPPISIPQPISKKTEPDSEMAQYPDVMSSFRPANSAKLYASPEELKSFGIRANEAVTLLRKNGGTSKSRSQSLPPIVNRLQQNDCVEKETSGDSGVYSSTYSTFRENTPDLSGKVETNNVSQGNQSSSVLENNAYGKPCIRSLPESSSGTSEIKTYTRSVSFSKPSIPDPDYSSEDESAYSLQEDLPPKKIKSLKKKKQTVMFAPNLVSSSSQDMSDLPHYAAPSKGAPPSAPMVNSNFADLIAQKAAERKARQENGGGSAPASTTSSPSKRKNSSNVTEVICLTDAIKGSNLFNRQKERATEVPSPMTQTTTTVSPKCIKPSPISSQEEEKKLKMKNSMSCPNEFNIEDGDNSSSGVSSDQEHIQQETNYVTVINTESEVITEQKTERLSRSGSRDDSSEASESSDEASDRTWILTNEKGDRSDSGKDSDSSSSSRRSGNLTKNAVSLVKLPPPQESYEPDHEFDPGSSSHSRIMSRSLEPDALRNVSSLSCVSYGSTNSKDIYHSFHQRQMPPSLSRSLTQPSSLSHNPASTVYSSRNGSTPPVSHAIRSAVTGTSHRSNAGFREQMWSADAESIRGSRDRLAYVASRSATLDRNFNSSRSPHPQKEKLDVKYERSIEESLQLIRMHMDSLNEVNTLAGINAPRPTSSSDMVLAPPPEFCDASLGHRGALNRGRGGKTVIRISGGDPTSELPVRIVKAKRIGERVDDLRTFRNKPLSVWSTKDTTDWLESLFMPEYKESFAYQEIDGTKLMILNNESLINLGIRKIGHRVKMEKSLKRYRPVERIDL